MADVTVTDVPEQSRYEARTADGELAGVIVYAAGPPRRLEHTVVQPAFEGQGVAAALVVHALEAARSAGAPVVPVCPYVQTYLRRHPEYADAAVAG